MFTPQSITEASSAPIPKFASACGTSGANFGIKRDTSNFLILVRFLNLKFLRACSNNDRNFKFTALVATLASTTGRGGLALTKINKSKELIDKVILVWMKELSMTSGQSIAVTTMLGLGLACAPAAWASPKSDACAALVDARNALYSMINAKDRSAQDALNTKVQAASTKLDSVLAGMTEADAKLAADFKAVWDQFKETREKEIIAAIHRGDTGDAKKIADGIQLNRLSQMWRIMSCK